MEANKIIKLIVGTVLILAALQGIHLLLSSTHIATVEGIMRPSVHYSWHEYFYALMKMALGFISFLMITSVFLLGLKLLYDTLIADSKNR